MDSLFIKRLDELREKVGPIQINSGFRCLTHNKNVGGHKNSWHTKGTASDCVPLDVPLKTLKSEAHKLFDEVLEYPTFIHVGEPKEELK